ncbi:Resistance to glucose repression 1 [Fusarium beomiforme]|uniref:Resistance to glucose repression 1 n=1 Tax=Fusarium beomiforme TaxID=44412 RepID=A0A9P5E5F5_9HYPO|nr:Resistance to glucose repression 1 [Fusarium beomiforme]
MDLSDFSTPARGVSTLFDHGEEIYLVEPSADNAWLPQLVKDRFLVAWDDGLECRLNLKAGNSYNALSIDDDNSADTSTGGSPESEEFHERADDDTAVNVQPWKNVDYLSHEWKEEDIWSSWKYITSRRGEHPNNARLENACWRTWTKCKNDLKTVSPETLNWLKDYDVRWLYGPLQPSASKIYCTQTGPSGASLFWPNSLENINRKPILKKTSMSHIRLQRPLSTSPLPQQALPMAQTRQKDTRRLKYVSSDRKATTHYIMSPFPSTPMSRDPSSMLPSTASTGILSPCSKQKHIHFNYTVEQCIAVEVNRDDDADDITTDNNSHDGIMMKLDGQRKPAKEGNLLPSDGTTIAMLPSTTLKDLEHIPEVPGTATHHTSSTSHSYPVSPASLQETAGPPKRPGRFSEDLVDVDPDSAWHSSGSFEAHDPQHFTSTDSLTAETADMRRTPTGMFMHDGEAVTSSNKGVFCRIVDTINMARDIAWIIWDSF